MRKTIIPLTVFVCVFVSLASAGNKRNHSRHNQLVYHPDVIVDSFWINHDRVEDGKKGMVIHLKFSVYGLKDVNCAMVIYFNHDFEKPIKDKNQKYYTKGGDVAVYSYFKPIYDTSNFADLPIFMPYDELDLSPGT